MNEWIFTSDRIPPLGDRVLFAVISNAWDTTPVIKTGTRWAENFIVDGYKNNKTEKEVVAWMPLPELPTPPNWRVKRDE